MTLKLRFTLLLSLLLGGFLVAVAVLRHLERTRAAEMLRAERDARAQLLNHRMDAASRALPQFTDELAQSEEFATALERGLTADARQKLAASLAAGGMTGLWVLTEKGIVTAHVFADGAEASPVPPIEAANFAALVAQTPRPRFFAEHASKLLEVCARRLQPAGSNRRKWLVVARAWDDEHLRALASLTEANVSLGRSNDAVQTALDKARVELLRPLPDWQGHPLRVLRATYDAPQFERAIGADRRHAQVFIAFGLILLVATGIALHRWVLRPLRLIGESLSTERGELVSKLSTEKSELGRVAQLVQSSFAQRAALEREVEQRTQAQSALARSEASLRKNLEERARLGRDLHDGVIQSLYAAGMGLAGIRMQLQPGQTEAATRLDQTRAALNETIHDIRNFVAGLEPEVLRRQTFAQAVATLLETMRSMRPFRSTLDVDDDLAARLTLAQRAHALQITREAVSNAIRHAEASHVHVALRSRGEFVEFQVVDNGRGFAPADSVRQGRGLANFAERARELGGELTIDSQPGQGTRVKLSFSLLTS